MCIDTVEIGFGFADRRILSSFDSYLPETRSYFHFWAITLLNTNGFSPSLVCAMVLLVSNLGLLIV